MFIGFVIWTAVALILVGIGINAWNMKEPVGFFTGQEPPKVKDTEKYNHSVAILWFVYGTILEVFGIPLLFLEQNSPVFVISMLGPVFATIGLVVAYNKILDKNVL